MYFCAIFSEDNCFFGCVDFDYDLLFIKLVFCEDLSVGKWEYTEFSLWFAHEEELVFEEGDVVDFIVIRWLIALAEVEEGE
jgi:hypothetical protein